VYFQHLVRRGSCLFLEAVKQQQRYGNWSKGFSSETNSNAELVLDVDVKKKVRTASSVLYKQFRTKYVLHTIAEPRALVTL
jgi:hypothetical protein